MDIDVERSDLDVSGSGGATTRVWGVRHASEEVDLSTDDPLGTEGFETEPVPARAVLVYEDPPRDGASPDGVYPTSRIASGEAGDREILSVTVAAGGNTRTVDRVLRFEARYGDDRGDDEDDHGDGPSDRTGGAPSRGSGRAETRTTVELDDGSEWDLGGRPVTVTADRVESITGE